MSRPVRRGADGKVSYAIRHTETRRRPTRQPEHQRKFGYYTLPILWGDQLVARFDSKLDRATNTFVILGFWLENESLASDETFAEALARGFARFVTFLGASTLDATAMREPLLRQRTEAAQGLE